MFGTGRTEEMDDQREESIIISEDEEEETEEEKMAESETDSKDDVETVEGSNEDLTPKMNTIVCQLTTPIIKIHWSTWREHNWLF